MPDTQLSLSTYRGEKIQIGFDTNMKLNTDGNIKKLAHFFCQNKTPRHVPLCQNKTPRRMPETQLSLSTYRGEEIQI